VVSETPSSPRQKEYGVEYHENYVYELLREAGLSLRIARPQHHEADPEEKAEFQETVEKTARTERKTVVVVDQFTKHVGTVQRRGWYPTGSDPTIETATSWELVTVLGAVTDDGDSFYCWTDERTR